MHQIVCLILCFSKTMLFWVILMYSIVLGRHRIKQTIWCITSFQFSLFFAVLLPFSLKKKQFQCTLIVRKSTFSRDSISQFKFHNLEIVSTFHKVSFRSKFQERVQTFVTIFFVTPSGTSIQRFQLVFQNFHQSYNNFWHARWDKQNFNFMSLLVSQLISTQ